MAKVVRKSNAKTVLAKIEKLKNRAVSAAIKEAAEVMQRLVPVAEGDLKSTIKKDDDGNGHGSVSVGGKSEVSDKFVDYERHVEFGTEHENYSISAQPFFRPGLDAGRRKLRSELKNG